MARLTSGGFKTIERNLREIQLFLDGEAIAEKVLKKNYKNVRVADFNSRFDLLSKERAWEVTVRDSVLDENRMNLKEDEIREKESFADAHKVKMASVLVVMGNPDCVVLIKDGIGDYRASEMRVAYRSKNWKKEFGHASINRKVDIERPRPEI